MWLVAIRSSSSAAFTCAVGHSILLSEDAGYDFLRVLCLQVFLDTARVGGVAAGGPPPAAFANGLSVPEACRIRDRSTILARQLYAEQGPQLADQQVRMELCIGSDLPLIEARFCLNK